MLEADLPQRLPVEWFSDEDGRDGGVGSGDRGAREVKVKCVPSPSCHRTSLLAGSSPSCSLPLMNRALP